MLCLGFSLQWLLFLQGTGSGRQSFSSAAGLLRTGLVVVAYRLNCPKGHGQGKLGPGDAKQEP